MRQTERDSKKRIAFPIQLFAEDGSTDAQIPSEIHVVPTGKWDHPVYGEMEITSADIAEFVSNFNDKVRRDIPITAGHDNGMNGGELPAVGWFTDVIDRGVNGLWAGVKWTEEGVQLLQQRAFKYFSPEFYEQYTDPETGDKYGHVLVGGALTNKPYFKELAPVASFSEPAIIHQFTEDMNLNDILSKKPEELSDEEKAFVREHEAELTDDQKTAFASVISDEGEGGDDAGDGADDGDGNGEGDGQGEGAGEGDKGGEHQAAEPKGKKIVMSEAEVAALRKAADDGAKALQKIEATERRALIAKLTFSETNRAGRFLPKQEGALESFLKTLSERQRDAFTQLIGNMPKADASIFDEVGDGGGTEGGDADGIAKEVDTAVQAAIKASEGKLGYSDALRKVYAENPDLKRRYEEALAD